MTKDMHEDPDLREAGENSDGEKEIDLLELAAKLWAQRKLLLIWCMWGVIAGLIIAFSIPREYSASVKLAPEVKTGNKQLGGGIAALANIAGISTAGNSGSDAMYPQLYPDIVGSVPFLTSLFDVPVTNKEGEDFTVREYLEEKTYSPWWGFIMGLPGKIIGVFSSSDEEEGGQHQLNNFKLTKQENKLVESLRKRITANVDQKTSVITIDAKMQDPIVSAILVDTVVARLREYITDYRTDKARQDLAYAEKLNREARDEYYKAQQSFADYVDKNQNLATRSAAITRERLSNEASLAFNLYNETSLQVQNAKSKVQEITPVYTVITPATVPIIPSAPRKGLILAGFIFLSLVGGAAWILFGSPMVDEYKRKSAELNKATPKKDEFSENKKD